MPAAHWSQEPGSSLLLQQWHDWKVGCEGGRTWGAELCGELSTHWKENMLRMNSMGKRVDLKDCSWDWDKMGCRCVWKRGEFIGGGLWTIPGVGRKVVWGWMKVYGATVLHKYESPCQAMGKVNRTVHKIPQLAVTAVKKHLGVVSLSINTAHFSFCSLQGEILHIVRADLDHFSNMD